MYSMEHTVNSTSLDEAVNAFISTWNASFWYPENVRGDKTFQLVNLSAAWTEWILVSNLFRRTDIIRMLLNPNTLSSEAFISIERF